MLLYALFDLVLTKKHLEVKTVFILIMDEKMECPGGQGLALGYAPGERLAGDLFLVLSDSKPKLVTTCTLPECVFIDWGFEAVLATHGDCKAITQVCFVNCNIQI